ncbi:MAG: hypothetical protein CL609_21010 [Anaerolineaceae bacterium]|nr:hypothetical protein [Anaerolineaceae bacterium]
MIQSLKPIEPIDYLVIGHITQDKVPGGVIPGGTVSYASLTALSFGLRVGVYTSITPDAVLPDLSRIQIINQPTETNTIFENIYDQKNRKQILHASAAELYGRILPQSWLDTPIVHLGPVINEIDPSIIRKFPNSFIGITPQGWYRQSDEYGNISFAEWLEANHILSQANAAVISLEDVQADENLIANLVYAIRVLVVTEGSQGCRVYWNGDVRRFSAPVVEEVNATGAGDIFAATFFIRLKQTQDPWEAARFATLIASTSVTRNGMASVPTDTEIQDALIEIITKR